MRRLALNVIAIALVSAAAASAQTPGSPVPPSSQRPLFPPGMPNPLEGKDVKPATEIASAFGLKGHFAVDCSTDAGSPGHVQFNEQADGSVMSEGIDPDGSRVRTIMFKGKRLDDVRVEFLGYASYNGPPLKRLIWQKDGEKFRFVSSQTLEGVWLIQDSRLRDRVWQWVTPCADKPRA